MPFDDYTRLMRVAGESRQFNTRESLRGSNGLHPARHVPSSRHSTGRWTSGGSSNLAAGPGDGPAAPKI